MRRINWKSTAKAGKLLVNMYESSFSQEIQILLNGDCRDERHKRELQEMAISLLPPLRQSFCKGRAGIVIRQSDGYSFEGAGML